MVDAEVGGRRRGDITALSAVLALMALAGCAGPAGSTASRPEPTQASRAAVPREAPGQELKKLKFGYPSISVSTVVIGLMKEAGIPARYGLDMDVVLIQPSTNLVASMVAGDVPMVATAAQAVIQAHAAGADTVMITGGISPLNALMARPPTGAPGDLRGKRIGISRFGTADDFAARYALRAWSLSPETDVLLVPIGGQPERLTALETGAVDVATVAPPFTVAARKLGFVEVADLADVDPNVNTGGLATTREFARREPDTVLRVVKAYADAIHTFRTNRDLTLRAMAQYSGIQGEEELADAYQRYSTRYLPEVPRLNSQSIQLILDNLSESDPRVKGARPEEFMEPRFLKELEDSGFFRQLWR